MKKWKVSIAGSDGRTFSQDFHVVASSADHAKRVFMETFKDPRVKLAYQIRDVAEIEEAEFFLPGINFRSERRYA
jgi:hypothetical protein